MILHVNLLDLSQANGTRSPFPPYTWGLEPLSRAGAVASRIP